MKIIGINGSPRAKGNTRLALDTMGEVFAQEGVEFDILHIGHKLSPCSGCFRCAKTHTCTLPDDGLNAMYDQLIQADGISLGWAKGSGGQLKNHFPKGLRRPY